MECPICLENKKIFFTSSCSHTLCINCFKKINPPRCPLCRKDYSYIEILIQHKNNKQIKGMIKAQRRKSRIKRSRDRKKAFLNKRKIFYNY
jgi:hypothetical protein